MYSQYLCAMKTMAAIYESSRTCIIWCMVIFFTAYHPSSAMSQSAEPGDSIRINPEFMKALDKAFSFDQPLQAPIKVPNDVLTREQLHEWVGPIENSKSPTINIPGLGGFTDGLQHYGKHWHSVKEGGVGCTFDFNALAKYIRPSEIRLRKMRSLAASAKETMDKLFPMEGKPLYSVSDTVALSKR